MFQRNGAASTSTNEDRMVSRNAREVKRAIGILQWAVGAAGRVRLGREMLGRAVGSTP